jgi:hypothetical protein
LKCITAPKNDMRHATGIENKGIRDAAGLASSAGALTIDA